MSLPAFVKFLNCNGHTADTSWLDTETKAALQQLPPQKLVPATTETFSVVILSCDARGDHTRQTRAFDCVLHTSLDDAEFQTRRRPPFVVKGELTMADAMLAQFELACCDIVSVFISDGVLSTAEPSYLAELYGSLIHADEFDKVSLRVFSVPENAEGCVFVRQFIGDAVPLLPYDMIAMRKKARIMTHWAKKVGVSSGTPDRIAPTGHNRVHRSSRSGRFQVVALLAAAL